MFQRQPIREHSDFTTQNRNKINGSRKFRSRSRYDPKSPSIYWRHQIPAVLETCHVGVTAKEMSSQLTSVSWNHRGNELVSKSYS